MFGMNIFGREAIKPTDSIVDGKIVCDDVTVKGPAGDEQDLSVFRTSLFERAYRSSSPTESMILLRFAQKWADVEKPFMFSVNAFCRLTGLHSSGVHRTLKQLILAGAIGSKGRGSRRVFWFTEGFIQECEEFSAVMREEYDQMMKDVEEDV